MFQRNTLALSPGSRGPRRVAVDSFEVLVTIYKSTQYNINTRLDLPTPLWKAQILHPAIVFIMRQGDVQLHDTLNLLTHFDITIYSKLEQFIHHYDWLQSVQLKFNSCQGQEFVFYHVQTGSGDKQASPIMVNQLEYAVCLHLLLKFWNVCDIPAVSSQNLLSINISIQSNCDKNQTGFNNETCLFQVHKKGLQSLTFSVTAKLKQQFFNQTNTHA